MRAPALLSCLTVALCTLSCSTAPIEYPAATRHVLPTDIVDTAWVFDARGASHPTHGLIPAPAGAGEVRGSAIDQSYGVSAVLYDGAVAFVEVDGDKVDWVNMALPQGSADVAMRGGLLGIATETAAVMVDVETRQLLWREDLTSWLKNAGTERADLLVPETPERFALVSSLHPSFNRDGLTLVQTIDKSRGQWMDESRVEIRELSRMGKCRNVGQYIYVSGIKETARHRTGQKMGRLLQTLRVFQIDAANSRKRELFSSSYDHIRADVAGLATSADPETGGMLLSVLMQTGQLMAYRVNAEDATSRKVLENLYEGAISTAWDADGNIVVGFQDRVQTVKVID